MFPFEEETSCPTDFMSTVWYPSIFSCTQSIPLGARIPSKSSMSFESEYLHVGNDCGVAAHPAFLSEILETAQKLFQFIGSKIHYLRKAKYGFARLTIMASILKDSGIREHFQLVG